MKQWRYMAKNRVQKQKKQVKRRRSKWKACVALLVLIAVCGALGLMYGKASVTRLRYAQVYLSDLPAAFDGTKVLFISDFNIRNANEERACERMMQKLQSLDADILILGGDYSADNLFSASSAENASKREEYAKRFLLSLSDFSPALGKYAVLGEEDDESLTDTFAQAGVRYLKNDCAVIEKDSERLCIVGLQDISNGGAHYEQLSSKLKKDECVLVAAHDPSAYVGIRVAEASDGGSWADLVLCGHTLGGQMRLFGRNLRELSQEAERCLAGWYYTDDLPMLVSQGLGCKDMKLRLGTRSEIWCITLQCTENKVPYLPKL